MAGAIIPSTPDVVTFRDGERLIPEWQCAYLTGDESTLTYQEWVERLNQSMLANFIRQAVPVGNLRR